MDFIWETGQVLQTSITEQIKINRKISQDFLESLYSKIPDINLLKDLEKSATRIIESVRKKENIMIYGHDDMDGFTSTYILFDYLEKVGSQQHYYHIPNRLKDSHGIQKGFISKLKEKKIDLLITVDGGISEFDAVDEINKTGCDVIITDHHIVQGRIPNAFAVVNPKQADCKYPFDNIAGVTISYFLVQKLSELLGIPHEKEYLFWVSVGSISDKVPMIGINRTLIKKVLDEWASYSSEKLLYLEGNFNSVRNNTGRLNIIRHLIKLLSSCRERIGKNSALSFMMNNGLNNEKNREELLEKFNLQEQKIFEIKQWLSKNFSDDFKNSFVYYDNENNIPIEFLGICANHLSKSYMIPVLFLKKKNHLVSCEARSTKGFDLIEAFRNCNNLLIQYGGHKQAAGFTIYEENVSDFISCFKQYTNEKSEMINSNKKLVIDAVIGTDQKDELEQFIYTDYHFFQPYGEQNPSPLILLKDFKPARDIQFQDLIKYQNNFDLEKTYDLVLKTNNSSIKVIDYKEKI